MSQINPTPQLSFSLAGSYKPCFAGKPFLTQPSFIELISLVSSRAVGAFFTSINCLSRLYSAHHLKSSRAIYSNQNGKTLSGRIVSLIISGCFISGCFIFRFDVLVSAGPASDSVAEIPFPASAAQICCIFRRRNPSAQLNKRTLTPGFVACATASMNQLCCALFSALLSVNLRDLKAQQLLLFI